MTEEDRPARRAESGTKMNYESSFARHSGNVEVYDDEARSPRKTRRMVIIAAIAVLLLGIAALAWKEHQQSATVAAKAAADGKQSPTVTVITPGRQLVQNIVSATGTLAARREMPIGAAGEGGLVARVLVQPGDWVSAGQVLAVIDRQVQVQQSSQLAAQINVAQADARLAESELVRAQSLVARGFISKADIDRKTATRDAARARVRVAQAQLSENSARVGRLDVRAPDGGLVLTRSVEPGQVVGPGSGVLFRLAAGGEMELKALLAEADLAHMAVGQNATITPVGTATSFTGQIWQLSPVIDPQTRQGTARIAVPYDKALRPGGFAATNITSGTVQAPLLPESAVQSDAKGNYVFVIGKGDKVVRRDVRVGTVTDQGVSITAGLAGNELVVLSAGAFLNPGETVVPKRAAAAR
jgi:HlyD family secretion protein